MVDGSCGSERIRKTTLGPVVRLPKVPRTRDACIVWPGHIEKLVRSPGAYNKDQGRTQLSSPHDVGCRSMQGCGIIIRLGLTTWSARVRSGVYPALPFFGTEDLWLMTHEPVTCSYSIS